MLKLLLKKQIFEVFRRYFYNPKTNLKRRKMNTLFMFILYGALVVGVIGGMSFMLSIAVCKSMVDVGMGWLFILIMSGLSIILGVFGSVFTTYSCLYNSKDNDLLLSMPIPVKYIVASRLLNVYLMGALFSLFVIFPAIVVYWVYAGITIANFFCSIVLIVLITLFVMVLSCLLGFVVAKVSLKVKNKSFVSILITLLFIGLYYLGYFKAQELIENLMANATSYGMKIKGAVYGLYAFASMGEGNIINTLISTGVIFAIVLLTWLLLKKTFLSIAISTGKTKKERVKEKNLKQKSVFRALLSREFNRFFSSVNYMLNCGIGVLFIPILGVVLLIKSGDFLPILDGLFVDIPNASYFLICVILSMLTSMINIASPSISLEGNTIWVLQSLPINPKKILKAKLSIHLIFSFVPLLFTLICSLIVLNATFYENILICLVIFSFLIFNGIFNLFLGIKMPILNWTNEITPIKQSGAVAISLLGGWGITIGFALLFFLVAYPIGLIFYLSIWTVVLVIVSIIMYRWIMTKGALIFSRL